MELFDTRQLAQELDIKQLISSYQIVDGYAIVKCTPATGILYITEDNPAYISGQIRMRGRNQGCYPFNYLEVIENIFGYEANTIEVCSRSVPGRNREGSCYTVDINPVCNPDLVCNGETLDLIPSNKFDRWRCDPPYNEHTAREMYGTSVPNTANLLCAGARVCKEGALMFLLLGPTNYQSCPAGVKRIGSIVLSVIPNNEWRTLNIYLKTGKSDLDQLLRHKPQLRLRNQSLTNYY